MISKCNENMVNSSKYHTTLETMMLWMMDLKFLHLGLLHNRVIYRHIVTSFYSAIYNDINDEPVGIFS